MLAAVELTQEECEVDEPRRALERTGVENGPRGREGDSG
jgi:hypothetical protein